ncbi:MAG TPA: 4-hydroxythreonine-4-phosphate dehydrogenase PdxA [Alphaproteobacteria bacterium]|nr:4-hydroxythreonine-4-phosphate dehydrogenase PdxA [Alphaproteobacteria bacterium]
MSAQRRALGAAPAPLAITMGEPAGIGGEILLAAWRARAEHALPPFFAIDDVDRLKALARRLGLAVPVELVTEPEAARELFATALPVLHEPLVEEVAPGRPKGANGSAVLASIRRAVDLARAGEAGALITNPIHKKSLYDAGFRYPGHTEYLAALVESASEPVMMLAVPGLRVVPVTIHLALAEALARLTTRAIVHCGTVTAASLARDLGIARPRLAVAALNPHSGEEGSMGREEIEIIAPAIETLRGQGIETLGPLPADTLFHPRARQRYDAVLCMYHDQALIPLKTIDFEHGVNVTLGLPFVRTSPDHGTAFDIAGEGRASPASLIAAIALAGEMATRRATAGALKPALA